MSVLRSATIRPRWLPPAVPIRASHSTESSSKSHKVFKQLGLYSLKKKIEDSVSRAEMIAPTALEMEEARRNKQEEVLQDHSLWDDLAKSDEFFSSLADAMKQVNDLKDLRYKAEEARLIMELSEMDVISHKLFKQAYKASLDVNRFLERYELSKLLTGPFDKEGACLIIKAGPGEIASEGWTDKLMRMYTRWAEKNGCVAKVMEQYPSEGSGNKTSMIDFESEYMYGYLSGERGVHRKICCSLDGSAFPKMHSAVVDVIPILLGGYIDMQIDDSDMEISYLSSHKQYSSDDGIDSSVSILHIPSGITAQCSGERSSFANMVKALNRLKAKLLVLEKEGVSYANKATEAVYSKLHQETRRYIFHPQKMVQDVKTGIQLQDLSSVLNGNLEPLIRAHINHRHGREMTPANPLL